MEHLKSWLIGFFKHSPSGVIASIKGFAYIYDDKQIEIQSLAIFFGDYPLTLACSPDGESISMSDVVPVSIDMLEHGQLELLDLSQSDYYQSYINKAVICLFIWQDQNSVICGVEFEFAGLDKLFVFNLGDSLWVSKEKSEFLDDEGYLRTGLGWTQTSAAPLA